LRHSHVVDLGDLVVEWLLEVPFALDVALDLAQALHALDVHGHLFVLSEELVLCQPLHEVALLQQVEVKECQVVSHEVFLGAKGGNKRCHLSLGRLAQLGTLGTHIARSSDGTLDFLELAVEHVDLGLFLGGLAEELGGICGRQVQHDRIWVRQLALLVDQVRDGWEVKIKAVLDGGPALNTVRRRVALLVHDILVGVLSVLEKVADRVSKSANLPIAELDRFVLCVQLLAAGRGVVLSGASAHCANVFIFLLEFADPVQSLILETSLL